MCHIDVTSMWSRDALDLSQVPEPLCGDSSQSPNSTLQLPQRQPTIKIVTEKKNCHGDQDP